MNLKNDALQKLYNTVVNYTVTFPPYYGDSPIDKAFKECDDKLSDSVAFVHVKNLQDRNDNLERVNEDLLAVNIKSVSKTRRLEKEIEDLKKEKKRFEEALQDTQTTLVKVNDDRANLQEACDKLSGENRSLKARVDCLRLEVNWYRKHYKEQSDKINELTKNYQDLSIKLKRFQINVGRESRYLWDMLQEVSDYYYFGGDDEFDTDDCEMTSMIDIIDNLNVDQFLEAYKNWHKAREQTWECTLEGNIKINGDLLGKVCGIKIDDD